jgi:predicted enzyme related to lactoylglutathione lyase
MKTKLDPRSLLLGLFAGATVMLCIAAGRNQPSDVREPRVLGRSEVADAQIAGVEPANPGAKPPDSTSKPAEAQIHQVTGIGGVFFKAKDPKAMLAWYRANLGIPSQGSYIDFQWRDKDHPDQIGHTAWRIFSTNTTYFGQSASPLMINYRVANMDRMLEQFRRNQVTIVKVEDYDYGRFAWITDPEGNRIELWEPREK